MTHPTNKSSGEKTADATIADGKAIIAGVNLIADAGGSNDVLLIIYDNTAASGTKVFEASLDQSVTGHAIYFTMPDGGVRCKTGIFCDITGTGASYIIHYR